MQHQTYSVNVRKFLEMLYILAGSQIGQSPKKLEGLPSYAFNTSSVLLLLTGASDVTRFDIFGLDKTDILMFG